MKIGITGGHLTPALGFIDWVLLHHPEVKLVYFGRVYSQTSLKQLAVEKQEISKRNVEFAELEGARISGGFLEKIKGYFIFFVNLVKAFLLLIKQKPDLLLSFGSYQAVPLVMAAWLMRIPVLAHEGTSVLSKANRLIFKLASAIAYSSDSLLRSELNRYQVPIEKTGTPLRFEITALTKQPAPAWLGEFIDEPRILLVLGGNQGSLVINNLISQSLPRLTRRWVVVHQCGRDNKNNHYVEEMIASASKANVNLECYHPRAWIEENELSWLYQHAEVCVARAGANTIEEIIFHTLPTLFIPLPFAHFQEQYLNALNLANQGAAKVLIQSEANPDSLLTNLDQLVADRKEIASRLALLKSQQVGNPAHKIYELAFSLCK